MLLEGFNLFQGRDCWDRIAEHVGQGVSNKQCKIKYQYISYKTRTNKTGEWIADEVQNGAFTVIFICYILQCFV